MRLKSFCSYFGIVLLSFLLMTQTGCVVESISGSGETEKGSSDDGGGAGGEDESLFSYAGCVDGQGVGTNSINLNFLFPPEASRVRLSRNGIQIAEFSQANAVTSHTDDNGLREGATYLYTCEALVDGLWAEGTNVLQISTLAINAPLFGGIDSAVVQSPNSVLVSWTRAISDVPVSAYSYQVFANVGTVVDWTAPPKAIVLQGDDPEALISNLGDELSYAFGVRACSEGDKCDTNMVVETVVTTDGGAPTSPGVTALAIEDGSLKITAPWVETHGGIAQRLVYVRQGPTGGTNIGDYLLQKTVAVTAPDLPPEEIDFSPLTEGVTYHVLIVDKDPSGQDSVVTNFESITVNDITPPSFGGITNIAAGAPADSVLTLSWTGIDTEAVDPLNGGTTYRILKLTDTNPIATNPCISGIQVAELNVSDYTAGVAASYDLTGLDEKSYHSICIKAVDLAGNVSTNANSLQKNTLDITAPNFLGIQGLSYNNQSATLDMSWNASTAEDIKEYRITLWVNQPAPPPAPTVLVRSHAVAATGTSLIGAEFPLADNDDVYVLVEACDLTEAPFGSQNCSSVGTTRTITVPDVTAPPNFLGIRGPTDIETPLEGEFLVKWNAPADWSDYRGFRVYNVDPVTSTLSILKTCPCLDYGCSDQITQCTVNGLNPYRTYRLHVRAYDEANNETLYLDPATNFSDKRTTDTSPPTFSSSLTVGASPGFELSWNVGVDNQYAPEPGAEIRYEVYQNTAPFDFSNPEQPDGNLKTSTTNLSFLDTGFIEAETYYYTVCATDASDNTTCDQLTRNFTVPDVTDPIITGLTSTKTVKSKVWELEWTMNDNISATSALTVAIRRRVSIAGDLATLADPVVYSGTGADLTVAGDNMSTAQPASLDPLSGVPDLNRKINYLVTVTDEEGNEANANITVDINNATTLTEIKGVSGPLTGGKLVVIYGTGFSDSIDNGIGTSTEVLISGNACTSVNILSENALTCLTPSSAAAGGAEVRIRTKINNPAFAGNSQYSEQALASAYEYTATPILCDNPGAWDTSFADGTGTAIDPYIVCNDTHLANIRAIANTGAFYKLGDNIDLNAISFDPLGNATVKFNGGFDGDGHVISNWTYNNAQPNIGFLGYVNDDFELKNLGLVNVDITASQSVGGIIGVVEGGVNKSGFISNVFVTGTITADDFVGGIIGRKQNNHTNFSMTNSYFVGTLNVNGVTGYGGGIAGFLSSDNGGFFQDVYSEGSVVGTNRLGGLFGNLGEGKQLLDSYSRATITGNVSFED